MVPVEGAATFQGTQTGEEITAPVVSADPVPDTPQPKQEAAPAPKKGKEKPEGAQPEGFVLDLLKSYPRYRTLYVDRHGGVYTPQTSELIRKEAVLYNNPHYNPNHI